MESVCINLDVYINTMQKQMDISTVKRNMWEVLSVIKLSIQFRRSHYSQCDSKFYIDFITGLLSFSVAALLTAKAAQVL